MSEDAEMPKNDRAEAEAPAAPPILAVVRDDFETPYGAKFAKGQPISDETVLREITAGPQAGHVIVLAPAS